jgi:multicomponent Na+:H+ antiporter subunit E
LKTIILSFTSLFLLWLLLSGYFKANLIVFGFISCALVTYISIKLKIYSSQHERLKFNLRLPLYIPWLLKEIIKSNLHVARCILGSSNSIQPQIVCSKPSQTTHTGLAVHANSITLTPGTISVDINDNEILVHALTNQTAQGIINGDIDKRVTKLESGIH